MHVSRLLIQNNYYKHYFWGAGEILVLPFFITFLLYLRFFLRFLTFFGTFWRFNQPVPQKWGSTRTGMHLHCTSLAPLGWEGMSLVNDRRTQLLTRATVIDLSGLAFSWNKKLYLFVAIRKVSNFFVLLKD